MCTRIGTIEERAGIGIVKLFKYNAKNKDVLAPFFTNVQGLICRYIFSMNQCNIVKLSLDTVQKLFKCIVF